MKWLDPRERVTMRAADRTPGPVGISLFEDDAVFSWRGMVVLMLTISDNHATDVLLQRVGVDAVNTTAARLGLTGTVLKSDLQTMLDSIGQDIGCAGWKDSVDWASSASAEELARADEQLFASRALDPLQGTRTTPRDMADLVRLIWTDQAGPVAACERVRAVMARQLTRHRIASGFRSPVRVAAKSGSLVGVVRNEIGVISYPDAADTPPLSSPELCRARTMSRSAEPSVLPPHWPSPRFGRKARKEPPGIGRQLPATHELSTFTCMRLGMFTATGKGFRSRRSSRCGQSPGLWGGQLLSVLLSTTKVVAVLG